MQTNHLQTPQRRSITSSFVAKTERPCSKLRCGRWDLRATKNRQARGQLRTPRSLFNTPRAKRKRSPQPLVNSSTAENDYPYPAHPNAKQFQTKGLEHCELMSEIFAKSFATGAFARYSRQGAPTFDDEREMDERFHVYTSGKGVVDESCTSGSKRKSSGQGVIVALMQIAVNLVQETYEVQWPLSLVISRKALTKYQLIFRFLFHYKHMDLQLCGAWQIHQVLEPNWHVMHNRLQTAKSIDDVYIFKPSNSLFVFRLILLTPSVKLVIEYHNFFLEKCTRKCLLLLLEVLKVSQGRKFKEAAAKRGCISRKNGSEQRRGINIVGGHMTQKGRMGRLGFQRGAIFRASTMAAANSLSISQDQTLKRRSNLVKKAQTTVKVGVLLGMQCQGQEEEVVSKLVELEENDLGKFAVQAVAIRS
ncbi:Gamma-tubulin complex component 2 [Camellia lanceoleosa]|uniref:Gamma-tubulin complex component 2 n=1 Tax=Camellia lanceoleosa TaxID=1840588 RepID=A0ACC0GG40_9ERIC|nr:Gamma-tubulin complex component 2 [Camellia lanceoleosa]